MFSEIAPEASTDVPDVPVEVVPEAPVEVIPDVSEDEPVPVTKVIEGGVTVRADEDSIEAASERMNEEWQQNPNASVDVLGRFV